MAKARKPFVSRKKRKEMQASREKRENFMQVQSDRAAEASAAANTTPTEKREVALPSVATVGEFAEALEVPVVKVISALMKNGIMAPITARIDFDTMSIIADELGFVPELNDSLESNKSADEAVVVEDTSPKTGDPRPPIVTIMGHVDHGKTSLLDKIRSASVASGEHGGITQHIGAYQTEIEYEGKPRTITFLDTPGHEAFTALRSHGAQVTDIVILVVASDDGVKPQTIEAINHAKSANVPIIVALTKSDLQSANAERVKQQLTEYELIAEEWGGKIPMMPVSSVTGDGIQELLEVTVLTADLKNYVADPKASPQGVVIESHQEVGLGSVATLLIQNGTLRVGDFVVMGQSYGKIRSMTNYLGERIKEARPSVPVQISGLTTTPEFGDSFVVVDAEKQAKDLVMKSQNAPARFTSAADISQAIAEGRIDTLNIVLKADAQGSIEALRHSIAKLTAPGVKALIVHGAIGDISLSDIQLASASQAIVVGFNVALSPNLKKSAANMGVTVSTHTIIYELLDRLDIIMKGLVKVEKVQTERGRLKIKKLFRATKEMQIVGGEITQGVAIHPSTVKINRDGEEIGAGKVIGLQKGPEAVTELEAGQECGVSIQTNAKMLPDDMLVFYIEEEVIAAEHNAAS